MKDKVFVDTNIFIYAFLEDVREFGMTWEDCESFLSRLGYRIDVTVSEAA